MPEQFDAYHKWLGIAPKDQPPHHYRLLGVDLFEADGDVIASAADQRMAHVRSFQAGQHSALSQKILNQISMARVCLLDPKKKSAYDQQLTKRLSPASSSRPSVPPAVAPAPTGAKPSVAADRELGFSPLSSLTKESRGQPAHKGKSPAAKDRFSNDKLTAAHLPPPGATWKQMGDFASSYSGYDHWLSHAECVEVANNAAEFYEKLGELPSTLDELRTCLFIEYQRYLDFGWTPDEKRLVYLRAVVEEIRRQVTGRA
jgi:hypothetical protein